MNEFQTKTFKVFPGINTLEFVTSKLFKHVSVIDMASAGTVSNNVSFNMIRPLRIGQKEIYCTGFPTGLLFDRLENKTYTHVKDEQKQHVPADGNLFSMQIDGGNNPNPLIFVELSITLELSN